MIKVNCNYTGKIPGIGKGPLVNACISTIQYESLKAQGFPLEVVKAVKHAIVKPVVTLKTVLPTIEERKVEKAVEAAKEAAASVAEKTVKAAESVEKKVAEAAATVKTVAEEVRTYSEKQLSVTEVSKLEEILKNLVTSKKADIKYPARYGTKWLVKQILNLQQD